MAKKRKQIDWEAIEREYRAGQLSISEISRQHEVSRAAINKKAKGDPENGIQPWARDLSDQVRKEIRSKLVSGEVTRCNTREAIDTAVERGVEVIKCHRKDILTGRSTVGLLMNELIESSQQVEEIENAIHDDTKGSDGEKADYKRRAMMLRAVSLPSRAGVIRDLSAALKNLIPLERQAFNLDEDGGNTDDPVETILETVREHAVPLVRDADGNRE